eukprot:9387475-Alexandrium_andersonii.AAC.1
MGERRSAGRVPPRGSPGRPRGASAPQRIAESPRAARECRWWKGARRVRNAYARGCRSELAIGRRAEKARARKASGRDQSRGAHGSLGGAGSPREP